MLNIVELSDEQINNCLVFLNRTTLSGAEADAMVMIKQSLKCAIPKAEYVRVQSNQATNTQKEV